ncbi:MAG: endopeptidase La [Oscillospiraceae bacterium]|nr:endopeptidase La [Oscillospiraceae bacterium]
MEDDVYELLPMLALRAVTVFPNMLLNFDVERRKSTGAVDAANEGDRKIFIVGQRDISKETPDADDMYQTGTVCHVKQLLRLPGGGIKVLVEGKYRARLEHIIGERKYYYVKVRPLLDGEGRQSKTARAEALMRKAVGLFDTYAAMSGHIGKEVVLAAFGASDPGSVADFIAQNTFMKPEKKQLILETLRPVKRLELICDMLARETEVLGIERQLGEKLRGRIEGQHREYVLREQLRLIQNELGGGGAGVPPEETESDDYRTRICAIGLAPETEKKLLREVDRLDRLHFGSAEATVAYAYLDTCLELPWNRRARERLDVDAARRILNKDHFGLEKVKERLLEYLAVRQLSPELRGPIICLVGAPGVGKTSVAISMARALGRKLARLSLGGVHDEAEIRGHRKTYIGSMPGRIINALNQAQSKNPLLLLDEIDKLGNDHRGDPASALLEALDPEQNHAFRDHYLELPFDLSEVMFVTTANTTSTIPKPLLDRMEVIELPSYTDIEKLQIAKRHLIPKQRARHGLSGRRIRFEDDAVLEMIAGYTREAGVRLLEREIASACRKTAAGIVSGRYEKMVVRAGALDELLGVRKYQPETLAGSDEVGLVKGLAWTAAGGSTLDVEVNVVPGTGKLELTGNLGDVMKESAKAAVSYIRSRAVKLGIDDNFYKEKDIHIHFTEGAVQKDGPSAGAAMAVAAISALTGAPVRRDIAMTGEITLRGRVLRIGGLKEKTMAAMRAGVKTVIIPLENEPDIEDIDPTVRAALDFITTDNIDGILDVSLNFSEARRAPDGGEAIRVMLGERVDSGAAIRQ